MPGDIIGYVNIFIGIVNILVGFLVLLSNTKKAVNKAYFFCTIAMGFWSLGFYFYDNAMLLDSKLWLQIIYLIAYIMTISQINFVLKLYGEITKGFSKVFFAVLGVFFLYGLYLLFIQDSVVISTSYDIQKGSMIAEMGNAYILYFSPIIVSLVFLFYRHITRGQKEEGLKRKQSRYYWMAGFCMILPLFVLDFVLPVFLKDTSLYKYSTLGNILWVIIIAYSIYNTRFLDVRLVLGKSVEFLFKSFYIFLLLMFFYFVVQRSLIFDGTNDLIIIIGLSIVASAILGLLNTKTGNFIQKRFIYSKYNPIEEIQKFASANSEELEMKNIVKNTISSIVGSFNPNGCSILLFHSKSREIVFQNNLSFSSLTGDVMDSFVSNWESINSNPVLIFSEIETGFSSGKEIIDERKQEIINFMSHYNIEIIIPLDFRYEIKGVLLLGNKIDNSLYSASDIGFLEGLIKNANVALGRSFLYQQLQTFNNTLQEKVNDQTKELQIKIKELEEARKKEADMIDIMGHELRTPATVVKLNVDLLKKYISTNPQDFSKYIGRIEQAVETEIGLINTLLTSAKLEGNKVEIQCEKVDIKEEMSMSIHGNEKDIADKKLVLKNNIPTNIPYVYADRVRVSEIFNNLISNAIKYTEKGMITVTAKANEKFVSISVEDTGKGISKEDISKLGSKFFRIDNHLESEIVRPGGTGLGLYVAFRLVRLMGGAIDIESQVGRGSKFTITLPVYNDQEIKTEDSVDRFKKLGLKK